MSHDRSSIEEESIQEPHFEVDGHTFFNEDDDDEDDTVDDEEEDDDDDFDEDDDEDDDDDETGDGDTGDHGNSLL